MRTIIMLKNHLENLIALKKEDETTEFYRYLVKSFIFLLLFLAAVLSLGRSEKMSWTEYFKTGASMLAIFEWTLLLYSLFRIAYLIKNKSETYGTMSRRIVYARYLTCICANLACLIILNIIELTTASPGLPYTQAVVLENLKEYWFQILVIWIISYNQL